MFNIKRRVHIYIKLRNWFRQFSQERPWVKQNIIKIIIDCYMIKGLSTNNFFHANKIKWKVYSYLFYIVFQVLKVLLLKICKIQPSDPLFIFIFISFYNSRYHFSQISRTSFKNIWKTYFRHEFTKDFCRWSLILICCKSALVIWQRQPHLTNSDLMY